MIKLPKEFATTEAKSFQPFENPPGGPYPLVVIGTDNKPSDAGKAMLTLAFDIASGPHKGAFAKFPKKYFAVLEGDGVAYFKGLLNAFKMSNDKAKLTGLIEVVEGEHRLNHQKFMGLVVGGNVRDEEYTNRSGQVNMGQKVAYLFPIGEMDKHQPMPPKMLQKQTGSRPSYPGQQSAPPHTEEDMGW